MASLSVVDLGLQAKIGSIVIHVEELLSPSGHSLDRTALEGLIGDPEVQEWLEVLRASALLPEKRGPNG